MILIHFKIKKNNKIQFRIFNVGRINDEFNGNNININNTNNITFKVF